MIYTELGLHAAKMRIWSAILINMVRYLCVILMVDSSLTVKGLHLWRSSLSTSATLDGGYQSSFTSKPKRSSDIFRKLFKTGPASTNNNIDRMTSYLHDRKVTSTEISAPEIYFDKSSSFTAHTIRTTAEPSYLLNILTTFTNPTTDPSPNNLLFTTADSSTTTEIDHFTTGLNRVTTEFERITTYSPDRSSTENFLLPKETSSVKTEDDHTFRPASFMDTTEAMTAVKLSSSTTTTDIPTMLSSSTTVDDHPTTILTLNTKYSTQPTTVLERETTRATIDETSTNFETTLLERWSTVTNLESTSTTLSDFETTTSTMFSNFETTSSTFPGFESTTSSTFPGFESTTSTTLPDFESTTSTTLPDFESTTSTTLPDFESTTSTSFPDFESTSSSTFPEFRTTSSTTFPDFETTASTTFSDFETTTSTTISTPIFTLSTSQTSGTTNSTSTETTAGGMGDASYKTDIIFEEYDLQDNGYGQVTRMPRDDGLLSEPTTEMNGNDP